jgi:hypothetical protein
MRTKYKTEFELFQIKVSVPYEHNGEKHRLYFPDSTLWINHEKIKHMRRFVVSISSVVYLAT